MSSKKKYTCTVCGYEYKPEDGDPDNDLKKGTAWDDVDDDWPCPVCAAGKDAFEEEDDDD